MPQPPAGVPSTRQRGVVVKFDGDRGFGFIRPDEAKGNTDQDVFVHIHNVEGRQSLHQGQRVSYDLTRTDKGPAAMNVKAGSVLSTPYLKYGLLGLGAALVLLLALVSLLSRPSSPALWLGLWVVALSLATFGVYGYDKSQATRGGPRVPEAILHLLGLLGGTPGAFVAMRVFHHKTIKRSFQTVFWITVALQVGALLLWLLTR
jgi:uncharacterized membrane protein YsdA (DUF1294 family)/cold shock CspA family protein